MRTVRPRWALLSVSAPVSTGAAVQIGCHVARRPCLPASVVFLSCLFACVASSSDSEVTRRSLTSHECTHTAEGRGTAVHKEAD